MELGQPFFPDGACPKGEGVVVSDGVGEGVSSGAGVGDGLAFLCLIFPFGVGVGDGVGEVFFCFGELVGDGVGAAFFPECLRCLRVEFGVGSGSKAFLIFVPNDSSAGCARSIAQKRIAIIRTHFTNSKRLVL